MMIYVKRYMFCEQLLSISLLFTPFFPFYFSLIFSFPPKIIGRYINIEVGRIHTHEKIS